MPTTKQAYEIARRTNRLAVQLDYALRTVEVGSGIPEAPVDDLQYGRQNGEWTEIIHSESGASVNFIPPGVASPEGWIIGEARGQTYSQLHTDGTRKIRDWTFNGIPGTSTGWI